MDILGVVATLLGIVTAVLNLVVFVREKERAHIRTGLVVLFLMAVVGAGALFPRYAPGAAHRLARMLPRGIARSVRPWLEPGVAVGGATVATGTSPVTVPAEAVMRGTFDIRIRRNLLGGIDAVVADCQFADLCGRGGRVLAWRLALSPTPESPVRQYDGVLDAPVVLRPGATAHVTFELKGEAREAWLAWHAQKGRGPLKMSFQGLDSTGHAVNIFGAGSGN